MLPSSAVYSHPPFCPLPSPSSDTLKDARQSSVCSDFRKALRLLYRSSSARSFLLTPFEPSSQLGLLTCSRPSFTIATKEEQEGALPGNIGLCYLGLPAFSDREGLSGGLVVTRYASRTHPLHDPSFIADVRVGRYVRDDASGEWCMITRSGKDRVVRLQYMHVTQQGHRERISLTCDSVLFDDGRYTDSVYFKCHDHEKHICSTNTQLDCHCQISDTPKPPTPSGLMGAAHSFIREGAHEWIGTVRVTVLNRYAIVPLLDVDDIMMVRSTHKAGADGVLSSQIRHLAVLETMSDSQSSLTVHCSIAPSQITNCEKKDLDSSCNKEEPDCDNSQRFDPMHSHLPSLPLTPPLTPTKTPDPLDNEFSSLVPPSASIPWSPEFMGEDVFGTSGFDEVADHFLVAKDLPISHFDDNEVEYPMLPADLSTLPAGVESCLEGMDLEDLDDDCFSLMTSERDTHSLSSALSTAGSDGIPSPDSVPMPGDDVLDAISSLSLSASIAQSLNVLTERPLAGMKYPEVEFENDEEFSQQLDPTVSQVNALPKTGTTPHKTCHSGHLLPSSTSNSSPERKLQSVHSPGITCPGTIVHASAAKVGKTNESSMVVQVRGNTGTALAHISHSDPDVQSHSDTTDEKKLALTAKSNTTTQAKQSAAPDPPQSERCTGSPVNVGVNSPELKNGFQQPLFSVFTPVHGISFDQGDGWSVIAPYQTPYSRPITAVGINSHESMGLSVPHGHIGAATGQCWGALGTHGTAVTSPNLAVCSVGRGGEAPKLAPRPPGMNISDGSMWNLNTAFASDQRAMASRLEAMEKERKAEERRKKNRQAAARSNAKKKNLMDGMRTEINKCKKRAEYLRSVQAKLRNENGTLKKRATNLRCR